MMIDNAGEGFTYHRKQKIDNKNPILQKNFLSLVKNGKTKGRTLPPLGKKSASEMSGHVDLCMVENPLCYMILRMFQYALYIIIYIYIFFYVSYL